MSKGSAPRPFEVDHQTFSSNFNAVFGKKFKCPVCTSDKTQEKHFQDYDKWHSYKKCDSCNFTWDRT